MNGGGQRVKRSAGMEKGGSPEKFPRFPMTVTCYQLLKSVVRNEYS